MRGIRRGKYKAVWIPPPKGQGRWELYDLAQDPGEINDLSSTDVKIMDELLAEWEKYYAETGMFEIDYSRKKRGTRPSIRSC